MPAAVTPRTTPILSTVRSPPPKVDSAIGFSKGAMVSQKPGSVQPMQPCPAITGQEMPSLNLTLAAVREKYRALCNPHCTGTSLSGLLHRPIPRRIPRIKMGPPFAVVMDPLAIRPDGPSQRIQARYAPNIRKCRIVPVKLTALGGQPAYVYCPDADRLADPHGIRRVGLRCGNIAKSRAISNANDGCSLKQTSLAISSPVLPFGPSVR